MIAIKRELANSQFSSDAEMQSVLVWRKSELEKNVIKVFLQLVIQYSNTKRDCKSGLAISEDAK